jgi:hypothetical protein
MKILVCSLLVFFGTLLAAGLLALGEPRTIGLGLAGATVLDRPALRLEDCTRGKETKAWCISYSTTRVTRSRSSWWKASTPATS